MWFGRRVSSCAHRRTCGAARILSSWAELLEKGTELKIVGYDYMTDGIVHLYQVTAGEETGYISGEYTASAQEAAIEVYDRFGVYMIHAGRADPLWRRRRREPRLLSQTKGEL